MTPSFRAFAALVAPLALCACGEREAPTKPAAGIEIVEAPAPAPPTLDPIAPEPKAEATPASEPTAASAESRGYSASYEACMNSGEAAQGVTPAMVDCIARELAVQDGRLNAVYQRVMASRTPEQATALRTAQRAWIKTRDADCKAKASSGGTIDRLNGPLCHLDATIKRTDELEAME